MYSRRLFALRSPVPQLLALLASALLLAACGGSSLEPIDDDATILAFGDSLTAGKGVSPDSAYPAVLSELTGRRVINAGVSGETTAEGLARLSGVLDSTTASLMILLEGGNDILRNLSPVAAKRNLAAMIELARERGLQVVLVGVPRKALFSSTAELYPELAEEYDVPLEDSIIASLLRRPSMKSDSVHFNAAGYRALAASIHELLDDQGAL